MEESRMLSDLLHPSLCFLWPNFSTKFVDLETEESRQVEKETWFSKRDHWKWGNNVAINSTVDTQTFLTGIFLTELPSPLARGSSPVFCCSPSKLDLTFCSSCLSQTLSTELQPHCLSPAPEWHLLSVSVPRMSLPVISVSCMPTYVLR